MKNLFTAIDNPTENGKTIFQVRFTTDERSAYEAALAAARRILDGQDEPVQLLNVDRETARKQKEKLDKLLGRKKTESEIVYICSPYRGDKARNIAYARDLIKGALLSGLSPICPHLYLPQILDDDKPEEREQALRVGLELLKCCDAVIVGARYGISEGMQAEIDVAENLGLLVKIYNC